MSTITKQAVQAIADLKSGYTLGHADVEIIQQMALEAVTLLDELEAVQTVSAARLVAIDTHHKMFHRERDRAEKAEKRIADYQELISGLVGVSSSILREVERINNASAAGKGEAS